MVETVKFCRDAMEASRVDVPVEVLSRATVGGRFTDTSAWESHGEFKWGGVRFSAKVEEIKSAGSAFLVLDPEPHRYHGKCKGCKRPVTALVRETVLVSTKTERFGVKVIAKKAPYSLDGGDASEVSCPDCGRTVYLARLKGTFNAEHVCDARCTNAKGPSCDCACGGANHGSAWGV